MADAIASTLYSCKSLLNPYLSVASSFIMNDRSDCLGLWRHLCWPRSRERTLSDELSSGSIIEAEIFTLSSDWEQKLTTESPVSSAQKTATGKAVDKLLRDLSADKVHDVVTSHLFIDFYYAGMWIVLFWLKSCGTVWSLFGFLLHNTSHVDCRQASQAGVHHVNNAWWKKGGRWKKLGERERICVKKKEESVRYLLCFLLLAFIQGFKWIHQTTEEQ